MTDSEQKYLLCQLNHFLAHPATGIERFTQMAPSWKDLKQSVLNDEASKKTAPEVEAAAASWLAEERDLCLHMSSHVGREVTAKIERKLADDPAARLKASVDDLVAYETLYSVVRVPNCASDIDICVDLAPRTVAVSSPSRRRPTRRARKRG